MNSDSNALTKVSGNSKLLFFLCFPFSFFSFFSFVMLCLVVKKMRGKRSVKFDTYESYVFVVLCLSANGSVNLKVEIIYNFLNFY